MGKIKRILIAIGIVIAIEVALLLIFGAIFFIVNIANNNSINSAQTASFIIITLFAIVIAWHMIDKKD